MSNYSNNEQNINPYSNGGNEYSSYNNNGERYSQYNDNGSGYSSYNNNGNEYSQYNDNGSGYNPYNQYEKNNYVSQNKLNQRQINLFLKSISVCYIILLILSIIFCSATFAVIFKYVTNPYNNDFVNEQILYVALLITGLFFSVFTFLIGIVLSVTTNVMKNCWREFDTIFILTAAGIFLPFLTLVAASMIISKINKMKNNNDDAPNYDIKPY